MKLVDGEEVIKKAQIEAEAMPEPFKSNFAILVEWIINKTPEIERKEGVYD